MKFKLFHLSSPLLILATSTVMPSPSLAQRSPDFDARKAEMQRRARENTEIQGREQEARQRQRKAAEERYARDEAARIVKEKLDRASAERLQEEMDAEAQRRRQEEYEQKLAREAQAKELERRRVEDIRAAAEEAFLRGDYSSSLKLSAQVGGHRVAESLYNLGKNYEEGKSVKRNLITALVFYQLASEKDQKYSKKYDRLWTAYIRESAYDPIKYAGINNWMGRFYGECRSSNYQSCDDW